MLTPTVVLTAGHCTEAPAAFAVVYTASDVRTDQSYAFASRLFVHPEYDNAPWWTNDVGAAILDTPLDLPDSAYGELPEVGSLSDLKTGKKSMFTAVGYGLQQINPAFYEAEPVRMRANPHLLQVDVAGFVGPYSLLLSNNNSTGGTCFGDSGGPNFLNDSNVVAGVTSFGINGNCAGTGGVFRMDRSWSLDWVNSFLD
jgi:secreted trypsin-like serine protease